ncbi:hypothetical protein BDW62DRAFT_218112 [Aspergillus aurantiobrunneus]
MECSSDGPRISITSAGREVDQRSESSDGDQVNDRPFQKHPIPQIQGAFEESIYEAFSGEDSGQIVKLDAQSRRKDLLENPQYERLCGRKWRQKIGERYHPLWKLTAQISFGVHLLVQGTAKSNTTVLNILQIHVDELDGFYLSLPLENLDDFDEMLMDRNFRLAMTDYNEKIGLAIERFAVAINDALKDIQKGKEAIGGLWKYLGQSAKENAPLSGSLSAIYNSMLANTEGWNSVFSKLRRKGVGLQYAITQLRRAITEMQRRVGVASRKDMVSFMQPLHQTPRTKSFRGLFDKRIAASISNPSAMEKPLPPDPNFMKRSNSRSRTITSGAGRLAHQKSVPNLRATVALDNCLVNDQAPDRAKSMNGAPSRGSDPGSIFPRFSKTVSRRLSRSKLMSRVTTEDVTEETPIRPSTSASGTLKSFGKSRHEQQQQQKQQDSTQKPLSSNRTKSLGTSNSLAKGDYMRDQLLQYFKSDRVLDAWEGITEREKKTDQADTKKDGLWSIFQAKSSKIRSDDLSTDFIQGNLQKQMAWLDEETKNLNTYSLKSRPWTAPKFHTISERLSFQGKEERRNNSDAYSMTLETDESIITALPAFPLPPVRISPASPPYLLT